MPRRRYAAAAVNPEMLVDFKHVLKDFTINYLLEQPENLVQYGIDYFTNLKSKGVVIKCDYRTDYKEPSPELDQPTLGRRKTVYAEQFNPEDEDLHEKVYHEKTKEVKEHLCEQAKRVLIFRSLGEEQFSEIIDAMFEKRVNEGDVIIREGDDGDYFYIIDSGIYEVSVKNKDGTIRISKSYYNSGSFGELALLHNVPRAATITAKTSGKLWLLNRSTFRRIVVTNAFKKRQFYEQLIDKVPMLSVLKQSERLNVADALIPKTFRDGEFIIHQGATAEGMYFIESGTVRVTVVDDSGNSVVINTLGPGDYFGELALVTHRPRAASVHANGEVKAAYLEVEAFERLLGPCMAIMKRNLEMYEDQLKIILERDPHRTISI